MVDRVLILIIFTGDRQIHFLAPESGRSPTWRKTAFLRSPNTTSQASHDQGNSCAASPVLLAALRSFLRLASHGGFIGQPLRPMVVCLVITGITACLPTGGGAAEKQEQASGPTAPPRDDALLYRKLPILEPFLIER